MPLAVGVEVGKEQAGRLHLTPVQAVLENKKTYDQDYTAESRSCISWSGLLGRLVRIRRANERTAGAHNAIAAAADTCKQHDRCVGVVEPRDDGGLDGCAGVGAAEDEVNRRYVGRGRCVEGRSDDSPSWWLGLSENSKA